MALQLRCSKIGSRKIFKGYPLIVVFYWSSFFLFPFQDTVRSKSEIFFLLSTSMAQYKAAMLRIFGDGATKTGTTTATSSSTSQFADTETTNNGALQSSQEEDVGDGSRRYEDVCDGNNNMQSNQAIHQQPPPMIKYIRESWVSK